MQRDIRLFDIRRGECEISVLVSETAGVLLEMYFRSVLPGTSQIISLQRHAVRVLMKFALPGPRSSPV